MPSRDINALQKRLDRYRQGEARMLHKLARAGVPAPAPTAPSEDDNGRAAQWSPPTAIPELPEGWMVGPPDFVGVGVERSGTTWWFRLLTSHPRVLGPLEPGRKELHFFYGYAAGVMPPEDILGYHARLPRPAGHLAGEWTPGYMLHPWMPRLLARAAPDARLLVMLRDPIDRYRSGLSYTFRDARATRSSNTQFNENMYRGLYFRQLQVLFRHFRRSQVLVAQYEKCRAQPADELRRAWAFIGADPDAPLPDFDQHWGHKVTPFPLDPAVHEDLVHFYADDVAALAREFPEIEIDRWPNFGALVR